MQALDPTATEPGLRERKRLETREALETAALDLALEHGVSALTVDQVVDRANVSRRTFFNYFASLDDALVGRSRLDADLDPAAQFRAIPRGAGVFRDLQRLVRAMAGSRLVSDGLLRRRMLVILSNPQLAAEHLVRMTALFDSISDEVSQRLADEAGDERSPRTDRLARMLLHLCAAALHHGLEEYRRDPGGRGLDHTITQAFETLQELKEHYL